MPTSRAFALSPSSAASQQHDASPFYKKHNMSLTQTYYLAHTARSKLSKEAARPEYDLRVLVGHANLLDGLMVELADAEREQENWFNESVRRAESSNNVAPSASKSTTITWADTLPPVVESSSEDESSDDDDDMSIDIDEPVLTRHTQYASITEMEVDASDSEDDDIAEDEESDSDELALTRTSSRASFSSPPTSPPELLQDFTSDEDEDEEESSTPPSPPTATFSAPANSKAEQVSLKGGENEWQVPTGHSRVSGLYV